MFDYIKDAINPRGGQYGATARAAAAAQRHADASEDMLALQLATSPDEYAEVAARIRRRRAKEGRRRAWWQRVDLIASALFVGGMIWCMAPPSSNAPKSAVTRDAPSHVSGGR